MPDIRINGNTYSFNSVIAEFAGEPTESFSSLSWEHERTRGKGWGARRSGGPLVRTSGKYEVKNLSAKFYADWWRQFKIVTLGPLGAGSYGDPVFPISVQLVEEVPSLIGADVNTAMFVDCTIQNEKEAYDEGTDALMTEVSFDCMQAIIDGLRLNSIIRDLI